MADRKQSPEFLGGGPKFNVVGKDNRPAPGQEEPVVAARRNASWVRAAAFGMLLALLAAVLLYLNDQNIGKTDISPSHNGQAISPDTRNVQPPAELR